VQAVAAAAEAVSKVAVCNVAGSAIFNGVLLGQRRQHQQRFALPELLKSSLFVDHFTREKEKKREDRCCVFEEERRSVAVLCI